MSCGELPQSRLGPPISWKDVCVLSVPDPWRQILAHFWNKQTDWIFWKMDVWCPFCSCGATSLLKSQKTATCGIGSLQ